MTVNVVNDVEARQLSLKILEAYFKEVNISVRLWDDTLWQARSSPSSLSRTTLVLRHPGALRTMLLPGTEIGFVESYLYDDIDIEGEFEDIYAMAESLAKATSNWTKKLAVGRDLLRLPDQHNPRATKHAPAKLSGKPHSIERDRQAVSYHYNVSNDFYKLFLGKRMMYSCAYFRKPEDDLDTAQEQKLEMLCRKLRLKPGQRVLDLGCGWGGLSIYAAQTYGVDVTGITLSQPQMELANERIAAAGMSQQARVFLKDYREIDEFGKYDALVSVGMFEHVGEALLPTYFERAYNLLKPGGVFLNHGIAMSWAEKQWAPDAFTNAYVFPDGELLPVSRTLNAAESAGFEVRDVESLREHYAMTLHQWVSRLMAAHEKATQFVDEPTYRVWRLYMAGCEHGFIIGRLNIYQSLLVKPFENAPSGLPLTREDWYRK